MEKVEKPTICDRCQKPMSEIWFHKKDDFEDVNICIICFEEEYGAWSTGIGADYMPESKEEE